ncbi:head GIN domain-containing protein [Leptobacterium sp. I13]|uniref:head GIN domain-containing protein n=1 Tax=Leptobacterium meishanense TaxID=3128904 RepID=UPI0030EB8334
MKIIVNFLVFFITIITFSQGKLEKEIGSFDELKVFDGISAELIKSDENKVVITGEDIDKVAIVNNRGRLKIRMEIDKVFGGHKTFAKIYYNGRLSLLDANENASIALEDKIEQVNIELRAQEGGKIEVDLNVQRVDAKTVTGGRITATGYAKNQDITINTGGTYEADKLITEQSTVNVNAGGVAYVNASEYVEASVKAGGTVRIYGKPKVIEKKKFLGGKIIEQ